MHVRSSVLLHMRLVKLKLLRVQLCYVKEQSEARFVLKLSEKKPIYTGSQKP